jgi:hypothetical protein
MHDAIAQSAPSDFISDGSDHLWLPGLALSLSLSLSFARALSLSLWVLPGCRKTEDPPSRPTHSRREISSEKVSLSFLNESLLFWQV